MQFLFYILKTYQIVQAQKTFLTTFYNIEENILWEVVVNSTEFISQEFEVLINFNFISGTAESYYSTYIFQLFYSCMLLFIFIFLGSF